MIKGYKEFNLELSGYRKAILQDKEMLGLKEQLQQKDNIINKAKEYISKCLMVCSILNGKEEYCLNNYKFDYEELLEILESSDNK